MRIQACIIACIATVSMLAVPARKGWQVKTMADGSEVVVRQFGDEYDHYYETKDGKIIETTEDGMRVSARRAPAYPQRAPQSIGDITFPPRGLVILVSFKDVQFAAENDSAAMWDLLNKPGYNYNGATGSAADYFRDQSNGQYTPVFDVIGPIVLSQNRAYYGGNTKCNTQTGVCQDDVAKITAMVKEACDSVDAKVDFTKYVSNPAQPNRIDFVYVIYAGIGENDHNSDPESIWPRRVSGVNITLDGKTLKDYACSGEIEGDTGLRNGIGTFCHEFGHVLGFPDYYDTNYGYNSDSILTPNCWSTMDQGSYNNNGKTPPNYSLFDKYYMGWLTPKVLEKDAQKNITMGTAYDDGYMITRNGAAAPYSTTDTVYYIENRQQSGWDEHVPYHGMLVWRVVYNASVWKSNAPNNTEKKPRYTVVPAGPGHYIGSPGWCLNDACTLVAYSEDNPFPGTGNVTSYTPWKGYAMTEITETGGNIQLKQNGGDQSTGLESIQNSDIRSQKILRDGQLYLMYEGKMYDVQGKKININHE